MNSMAFLLLANNNPEVEENQKMELTIGSLSFYIGPSGLTRLSDPVKLIGSVGKQNQDNHNVWIICGLFQRGKLAGQLRNNRKYAKET
jgi:hypothetical protein